MPSAAKVRAADTPTTEMRTADMPSAMPAAAKGVVTATMTAATRVMTAAMAAAMTTTMTAAALRKGEACGRQQGHESDDGNLELRHGALAVCNGSSSRNAGSTNKVPWRGNTMWIAISDAPNGLPLLVLPSDPRHHAAMRRWYGRTGARLGQPSRGHSAAIA
jgi:hypothetical protein